MSQKQQRQRQKEEQTQILTNSVCDTCHNEVIIIEKYIVKN